MLQVQIHPTVLTPKTPEWHAMQRSKHCSDNLKIKIAIRMDKPQNMKHAGYVVLLHEMFS